MSTPVIDPTSSVLSYPQWLPWQFQFSASNSPYTWRVASGGLPPGMTLQLPWSGTGTSNLFTITGHPFSNGTPVVISSLTGGGSAFTAVTAIYYVVGLTSAGGTFSLATAPNGTAINFTPDISGITMYQPGLLTGAATVPGVYNAEIVATAAGPADSAAVLFTFGIEPAAAVPDGNVDVVWDLGTNAVIVQTSSVLNTTPAARTTPILFVKEQDDLILRVRTVKNGTVIDLGEASSGLAANALKLVLKQYEPEAQIVISDGSLQPSGATGVNASYLVHALLSGSALAGALSNYEADTGTLFNALAELEVTYTNDLLVGGATLHRTSQTFTIQIERDLGEAA